jgi:RNA polymerase sigma factor (sigma-70 family)
MSLLDSSAPSLMRRADADLVEFAAGGDRRAWACLVDRFAGLIWSVARAHGLDTADASDVSQTTWLRLLEHIRGLREPDRVGGWLATTARHECLRMHRLRARARPTDDGMLPDVEAPEPGGEEQVLTSERDALLRRAFEGLADADRALLRMLVVEPPLSYREISDALGMPIGSIGPKRARCLRRLRVELERLAPAHAAAA